MLALHFRSAVACETSPTDPASGTLKVGVLLVGEAFQLLDIAVADVLGMMQETHLHACELPDNTSS